MSELKVHTRVVFVLAVGDGEVHDVLQVNNHSILVGGSGWVLGASECLIGSLLVLVKMQKARRTYLRPAVAEGKEIKKSCGEKDFSSKQRKRKGEGERQQAYHSFHFPPAPLVVFFSTFADKST